MSYLLRNRGIIYLIIFIFVLFSGDRIGQSLVEITGGSNSVAPYTTLAYANPELAATGFDLNSMGKFIIHNGSSDEVTYNWLFSIDGRVIESGMVTSSGLNSDSVIDVPLKKSGNFIFSIKGFSQNLTGVVNGAKR